MNLTGPLDAQARAEAKRIYGLLPACDIKRGYEHWAVCDYVTTFPDYNLMTVKKNGVYVGVITHTPIDNALGNSNMASHTAGRNTGAVGISVAAMADATPTDFGPYPLTIAMMEVFCGVCAAVAQRYDIDVSGMVDGEHSFMTHAEVAIADSYFPGDPTLPGLNESGPPYRWDLARLEAEAIELSKSEAFATGQILRDRIREYKVDLAQTLSASQGHKSPGAEGNTPS